jgi:hypothetical protein
MATPATRSTAAAARLRAALDATASSLAQPSLDGLLAAEAELTRACADLSFIRSFDEATRLSVRDDLVAAQESLIRSNRLGASLLEFVRVSLDARAQATGDDVDVARATAALSGRAVRMRA